MNITVPYPISTGDIVSNTATNGEALWNAGTTYAQGATCYKGNFVYESVASGNIGHDPETTSGGTIINRDWLTAGYQPVASPSWLIVGMINPLKMFDSYISTQTQKNGVGAVSIEAKLRKAYSNTLYLLNTDAATITVTVKDAAATVLKSITLDMYDGVDLVADEYEWCWSPVPEPKSDAMIDLGVTTNTTDVIEILAAGSTSVGLGKVVIGFARRLSSTKWGYESGVIDFSKITTDDFGETYRSEGRYAKEIKATCRVSMADADKVANQLIKVRATDCVLDFNEGAESYTHLIVYGLVSEWRQVVEAGDTKITMTVNGSI
ncbi:MAG: hypothetical protein HGB35_00025 [Geobacteraceae bacterium]|nr:hypothetical protein [Geobacteraceae bacterium]